MKWVIYILLICNIGFVAWHFRGLDSIGTTSSNKENTETTLQVENDNQLLLLSELKHKPKSSLGSKLCYSLGPFTKETHSQKAQQQLSDNGLETRQVDLRDTSRSGYWVTLPTNKTSKEARKQMARLKELKVKDYFLVATGSHANGVSLGVYSLKSSARRRIDEMIKLGFIPQMESVALPKKVYWLNWYKNSEVQPEESFLNKIENIYPQISKIERSCK